MRLWMWILAVALSIAHTASFAAPKQESKSEEAKARGFEAGDPNFGLQFHLGFKGFGGNLYRVNSENLYTGDSFETLLEFELQPLRLGPLGRLSFGPSIGSSWVTDPEGEGPDQFFTLGAQVRYQGDWMPGQMFIPVVGWRSQAAFHQFAGETMNYVWFNGPLAGLWIDLGRIDQQAAFNAYRSSGISRFYLSIEAQLMEGGDSFLATAQDFRTLFGLRIAF